MNESLIAVTGATGQLARLVVDALLAQALADSDLGIKRGELFDEGGDLRSLIGRPTTTPPTPSPKC